MTEGPEGGMAGAVALTPVDEPTLAALAEAAVAGADADQVTPPLTGRDEWDETRLAWFRDYHRRCRAGLDGPAGEATWAVLLHGAPIGSVRLKRTGEPGVVETGIWLVRGARGRGVGVAAMRVALAAAEAAGAHAVRADTAAGNLPAQGAMRRCGFELGPAGDDGRVHGVVRLGAAG